MFHDHIRNIRKEGLMKRSSENYFIWVLIPTATIFFLFGCATQKETAQPDTKPAPAEVKTEDQTKPAPAAPAKGQETISPPSSPSPSKPPEVSQPPAARTTEIALAFVNFRQGPSMDSKIINVLKKGTRLTVLEEKAGWLRVRLEDGTEGWVAKAMTTEGAQPKKP
jgi:uncharacterized protein YgiM (DUF1202 family)